MPGTTDTVKAILTPGEFVIRKEAVDMIGAPILEKINDMPEKGGHSSIDRLIKMATMSNMKAMYGGGMVNAGPKPMQMGGMAEEYGHGGMVKDQMMMMAKGGQLKPVPEDNPGLAKLPEKVRNRMGYMQDGGMVEDNLMGMMGGGMMKKPMSSYQEGGEAVRNVFRGIGADFDKAELDMDDGMYTMRRVLSVPAEQVGGGGGLRYYSGEATADGLSSLRPQTFIDAAGKMNMSPQDSIPVAMIEEYLSPRKRKGIMGLLGFQDGGMIGPPPPPMDDPLQIGMRQASPEMYAGQTLGGMSAEEALEQGIMQSQMMKNQAIEDSAMQSLQLLRLRAMMADPSMQESINPISLDSLINTPIQSEGMQMPTMNRDMEEMLNMEMMKRGREALMRGMMREGQEDPLEALR